MKKIITTAVAALAVVSLAACEVPEEGGTGSAKEKSSESKYTTEQQNAIDAAENYVDSMAFSEAGLVRQLSSKAGDAYPVKVAEFAVAHIDVDYNAEALEAAENYQDIMPMSKADLLSQLTSSAGDQFTPAQAQYAVKRVFG